MNFAQLHEALRLEILRRIEGNKLSGKSLALRTGMKQPHISNFLNHRRRLSMEGMDTVLRVLDLSVGDLLPGGIANKTAHPVRMHVDRIFETVPLVAQATAAQSQQIGRPDVLMDVPLLPGTLEHLPRRSSISRRDWQRFVAIRITAAQAAEMQPILRAHAILLIDRHYNSLTRSSADGPGLYAVNTGTGLAIRYVTMRSNRLILRSYRPDDPVALLEPPPGHSASELIVGRVCQILATI
jgi:transcriptional regulator with XRE-family HTH domain